IAIATGHCRQRRARRERDRHLPEHPVGGRAFAEPGGGLRADHFATSRPTTPPTAAPPTVPSTPPPTALPTAPPTTAPPTVPLSARDMLSQVEQPPAIPRPAEATIASAVILSLRFMTNLLCLESLPAHQA